MFRWWSPGERVATRSKSKLRSSIGEVGVGLDPGNVRAVGIPFSLQQVKLHRGADLITVLGQTGGVLACPELRARRPAVGDVGVHGIPVAVNGVPRGKA